MNSECNKRSHKAKGSTVVKKTKKLRCIKYFRAFVDKGKDMKTVFERLNKKPKKRRCKGRKCKNRKRKPKSRKTTKKKSKKKSKSYLSDFMHLFSADAKVFSKKN